MAVYDVTVYNQFEKWGWTYQWYVTFDGDDPANVTDPDSSFFTAWAACHHNYVSLVGYKITNVDKPRLSKISRVNWPGTAGATPAHPNFSIKLRLQGSGGASRFWSLRGLPQTWPNINPSSGQPQLPQVATTACNNLIAGMVSDKYQIRRLVTPFTNPWRTIVNFRDSVSRPGFLSFTTNPVLGAPDNSKVILGMVDQCLFPGLKGEWLVIDETDDYYTLPYPWNYGVGTSKVPLKGHSRLAAYETANITGGAVYSIGSRDTGRPFGLSRGRSSGVSCHR